MKRLNEFGDDVGEKISENFSCIMLFFLGVIILGIPLSLCAIFGIPLVTTLGAWILTN